MKADTLAGLVIALAAATVMPAVAADTQTWPGHSLSAIPQALQGRLSLGEAVVTPDSLTLTARKGSDFYLPQNGEAPNVSAPVVLFPVEGDFIFSARVAIDFKSDFDGAALLLYSDDTHWAKFLLERSQKGLEGVTSSVVRPESDDAYHVFMAPGQTSIWLKIIRRGGKDIGLYTSQDGAGWTPARGFLFDVAGPVYAGFEAQAPLSDEVTARFDHIRFESRTPTSYWQGE